MASGCIRDILVPNPSGGEAVQIGCPADLSGNPCRNHDVPCLIGLVYNDKSTSLGTSNHHLIGFRFKIRRNVQLKHFVVNAGDIESGF